MDLPIAATLLALCVLGLGAAEILVSMPNTPWARTLLAEATIVMVLSALGCFALGFGFNFLATLSAQAFGILELVWTVAALAIMIAGWRLLAPAERSARLRLAQGAAGGSAPPGRQEAHPPKLPRAA